jgi:hypothetical protein
MICSHPSGHVVYVPRELLRPEIAELAVCSKCQDSAYLRLAGTLDESLCQTTIETLAVSNEK